ncbi:hypothetical protein MATL_G00074490 [Megalops atlanticus]|uniref:Uncharacterized protein n=1 Tax=Megalops atlanticus TaxID=7932 RepID=A0A9D3Q4W4_MEGAT|nr:hypothetical protein MATL_G00074490 [Megalops atlanticus]
MESVYTDFELYNFEDDCNYQNGFKRLHITDENHENILKFKIFYYNRFVKSIDLEGYKRWIESRAPPQTDTQDDNIQELQKKCNELCIQSDIPESDAGKGNSASETVSEDRALISETSVSCPQTEIHPVVTDSNSAAEPVTCSPLSFAEVFRLIQAGEDVPGLQKLDIRPCHQTPTASQISRKPKPWEQNEAC